ncbi:GD20768 [Drosophila simulans]|uniref:GD20768 n=1 Tax=Drosophila simulans TaxID=7240 RepID=B4QWH3_DROSI|nr:GD20768 [Drosophila simulans]
MHRIHDDEYSDDAKESDFKGSIQKEISVKSRHQISIPDICSDAVKNNCFPPTGFLNSSIAFASHVVKCSSLASSIEESSTAAPAARIQSPHAHAGSAYDGSRSRSGLLQCARVHIRAGEAHVLRRGEVHAVEG